MSLTLEQQFYQTRDKFNDLRMKMGFNPPGEVIYSTYVSANEAVNFVIVIADGTGGALVKELHVNLPSKTAREIRVPTEAEGLQLATEWADDPEKFDQIVTREDAVY